MWLLPNFVMVVSGIEPLSLGLELNVLTSELLRQLASISLFPLVFPKGPIPYTLRMM